MIKVEGLTKHYGARRALGPVSFEIQGGETIGFLGLNGAGKTTALRILACDLRPSSGQVAVGGVDAVADPHAVRKRIGFLPEHPPVYAEMTVRDYLKFAAALRGLKGVAFKKRLPAVLDATDLGAVEGEVIGTLSHGFRQRVGVAQAIVHDPEFLILDEPTRGLDPVQIVEMRTLIHGLKQRHTVLLSSHILTEISQTCDRLLVLGGGQLIGSGTEGELTSSAGSARKIAIGVAAADGDAGLAEAIRGLATAIDGVTRVEPDLTQDGVHRFLVSASRDVRADLARAVVGGGHALVHLEHSRTELENTFIRMVGGADGGTHGSN